MPSLFTRLTWTTSPSFARNVGLTRPSMSPPTPTKAILPSASSVRSRYRTLGVYSAAGLFFESLAPGPAPGTRGCRAWAM